MSSFDAQRTARLRRRHRAERRFVWYGRMAIGLAFAALLVLLASVVSRGYPGFFHTQMRVDLWIDPAIVTPADVAKADYRKLTQQGLKKLFPEATERRDVRALYGLLSSDAPLAVKEAVAAQPALIGQTVSFWLPVSQNFDRQVKGQAAAEPRESGWISRLQGENRLRNTLNLAFFTRGDSREPERAGFFGSMLGSIFTLLICLAVAFPLGVMTAVYLEEFAPKNRLVDVIEVNINNLAAVPSIVFGLLGLSVYLNFMGLPRSSPVVGGLTLALMTLPVIVITTRVSLKAVPGSIRDAARALGASPLQVVGHHVLPLALPGIMTGTILSVSRALGETAPLLMIGMVAFIADIPGGFTDPATAMPVQIYLWSASPEAAFVEKTSAGIMVLLVVLALMNALAIFIRKRFEYRW